jgi:hypothetical protein
VARAELAAVAADLALQHKPLHFLYVHRGSKNSARGTGTSAAAKAGGVQPLSSAAARPAGLLEAEPFLPQYLCPARPAFPFAGSEAAAMRACVCLQESVLRLRHGSAQPEATLAHPVVPSGASSSSGASGGGAAQQPVAAGVFECAPVNPVCVHRAALELTVGLAGDGYELHALFPATVQPADALAAAQELVAAVQQEAATLFLEKLPTY